MLYKHAEIILLCRGNSEVGMLEEGISVRLRVMVFGGSDSVEKNGSIAIVAGAGKFLGILYRDGICLWRNLRYIGSMVVVAGGALVGAKF